MNLVWISKIKTLAQKRGKNIENKNILLAVKSWARQNKKIINIWTQLFLSVKVTLGMMYHKTT